MLVKDIKMSFFDFFTRNSKRKESVEKNPSTMQKLANRYLIEDNDRYTPFGRPMRNYKITDMTEGKEFKLSIVYNIFDWKDLPKEEARYHSLEDNHYKVFVSVSSHDSEKNLAFFSSELYQKDFDIKEKINIHDVDLALYNQLKEARKDSSNPKRQEEAYLVSTLLRAAHDNIWIAPLLKHKNEPEYAQKLEQMQVDVKEISKKVQKKIQAYKQKQKEKQERKNGLFSLFPQKKQKQAKNRMSPEQVQQKTSEYIRYLMKKNFVDGI